MKGDSVFSPSEPARGRAVGNPSGFAHLSPAGKLLQKAQTDEDLSDWDDLAPGNLVIDLDDNSTPNTSVTGGSEVISERQSNSLQMPDRPSGSALESPVAERNSLGADRATARRERTGKLAKPKDNHNRTDLTSFEPLPKMKIKRKKMPTRQSGAKHEVISMVEENDGTQESLPTTDNSTVASPQELENCSTATSVPSSSTDNMDLCSDQGDLSPLKHQQANTGRSQLNTTEQDIEEPLQKRPKLSPSEKPETSDKVTWVRTAGTDVDPDLLGPCDPGTPVTLEGVVWNETPAGVLVVNVTWRGKNYVGTLLDCSKYDWAPPRLSDVNLTTTTDKTPRGRGGKKGNCRGNGNSRGKNNGRTSGAASPDKSSKEDSEDSGSQQSSSGEAAKPPAPLNESCLADCQCQFECPSSGCSKKFSQLSALKYHQNSAHRTSSPKTDKSPLTAEPPNGSTSTSVPPPPSLPMATSSAMTVVPANGSPSESLTSATSATTGPAELISLKTAVVVTGATAECPSVPDPILSAPNNSTFPSNSAPSLEFLANVATSLQSMEEDFSIAQLEQKLAVVTAGIGSEPDDEHMTTSGAGSSSPDALAAASGHLSAEEAESLEKLFEVVTVCKTTGETLPKVSPHPATSDVDIPQLESTTSEGTAEGERDGALSPAYSDISDANEDLSAPLLEKQTSKLIASSAPIVLVTPNPPDAPATTTFDPVFLPAPLPIVQSGNEQIPTAIKSLVAPTDLTILTSSSDSIGSKDGDVAKRQSHDSSHHRPLKKLKESHSSGQRESDRNTPGVEKNSPVTEKSMERPKSMTPGVKPHHNNNLVSKENLHTHHNSRPKSSTMTTTATTANSSPSPSVVKAECRSPCATPLAGGDQCRTPAGNGMLRGFSPCPPMGYHPNMQFPGFPGMPPPFGLLGGFPFDPSHPMFQAAFNPAMVGFGGPMMFGPHGGLPHELRPPAKALDLLQRQASQYYGGGQQNSATPSVISAAHKIHELAEHAKSVADTNSAVDHTANKLSSNGSDSSPSPKDRVKGALLSNTDKQVGAEGTKSPPVQRHLHTHHHTHAVLGAQLDPYAAMLASQQAAAAAAVGVHFASK